MNMQLNWQARASYTLLDTAFGVGKQFLARWASWVADPDRPKRLHYVAIAPTPATVAQILENQKEVGCLNLKQAERLKYPAAKASIEQYCK